MKTTKVKVNKCPHCGEAHYHNVTHSGDLKRHVLFACPKSGKMFQGSLSAIIQDEEDRHRKVMSQLRGQLADLINGLPGNPRTKRLTSNAFVVSCKDMEPKRGISCWSPSYHDFKAQYREILKLAEKDSLADALASIREVLKRESIRIRGDVSYTMPLHPDVISNVKKALESV